MTLFFKGDKPAIVWDGERGRQLVHFAGPTLEVTDERTAQILAKAGYEYEGSLPAAQVEAPRKPARSRKR